ncbi:hypothetical protein [Methanoculleus chikugoensis]|uniref:hypothetical protein n=1 Tax=Methanoculleus chikugoensis TaxID=118126 RepID=UPI001FB3718D|nr:hypothetical protein [Methanoculleus chikugoensis]
MPVETDGLHRRRRRRQRHPGVTPAQPSPDGLIGEGGSAFACRGRTGTGDPPRDPD